MKLANYLPSFRNVLFEEVREEKTASGIFVPGADFILKSESDFFEINKVIYDGSKSDLGVYKVVKIGPDCTQTLVGDTIVLGSGITPQTLKLDNRTYFSVMEQQIIGRERES